MTIQEEAELSFYEPITDLSGDNNIAIVRHTVTGELFVKKTLSIYNAAVYNELKQLDCPCFPHIYLCLENDNKLILIEEFLNGRNLLDTVKETGPLSEEETIRIGLFLCEAMNVLHSLEPKIIHRDIKPSNIICCQDGSLKLIDFNTSRNIRKGKTHDTVMIGTEKFAAPEMYGFRQSDERTDIYAVGVTLYYLLSGDFPESSQYSGKLLPVIHKCIKLEPEERCQNASQLAENLKKCDMSLTRSFLPPGFRTRTWWKMILGTIGYLMITWFCFSSNFQNTDGTPWDWPKTWITRIMLFAIAVFHVAFWGNYSGLRSRLPLIRKIGSENKMKYFAAALAVSALITICIIVLTIVVLLVSGQI